MSPEQSADPRRVLADRVEQLYSQLPLAVAATFIVGLLAAFELRFSRMPGYEWLFWSWCGMVALLMAARGALYWGYRNAKDKLAEAAEWLRWLGISAFADGTVWGFAGAIFFPSRADEQQVFLSFLITGLVAGGIPVYAVSWLIYATYAAAILFPFTYVLATFGNKLFVEIALLVPAFYAVTVGVAYRLNQVFDSGYRLRHAYGKLTEDYTALNQRVEQQLEDLLQAQREVEASGRKLALFAERAPIGVFELDSNASILEVNPAAEIMFGYPAAELIGRSAIHMLCAPPAAAATTAAWQALLAKAEPATLPQIQCVRRDAIEVICEFNLIPLVNDQGELLSVIAQVRDITQALEVEKMKTEFTSTLSHELRTPLTSIIGSLQLVNSGVLGDIDDEIKALTEVAERNGQRLLDLINDILDIEKVESGKLALYFEDMPLADVVRESLVLNQSFADRFRVRLEATAALPEALVRADRKRLLQVLTNLISNAAKFSPEGGAVDIVASADTDMARVSVGDRGPGIPEQFRNRIFSRFAQADSALTRQKGGTGLGLAICKRMMEAMNGRIGFDDREGGGTVFFIDIPLKADGASPEART